MSKRRSGSKTSSPWSDSNTSDDAALSQQIADVIMILDNDDDIPGTQPSIDEKVLKDVVAYVEVRSNSENRSRSVSKQLELLGAVVVTKFGPDVTHVIWKQGKKSTKDKAIKKGLHLVSVLWVDSCKQNQEHVAESLFPVHDPADGSPLVMAKLKRVKSMQPKSLEEENGTFKKRRRKRKLCAEDFEPQCLQNASPRVKQITFQAASPRVKHITFQAASPRVKHITFQTASPSILPKPRVLVEDTQQPMSPLRRIVGPDLTPTISLIPNTPESMRRALDSLSKRKMGTPTSTIFSSAEDSSPNSKRATIKHKKLFTSSTASSGNDTDCTITNSRMEESKDTTDSSDADKDQRPAKRQRLSSGQKGKRKSDGKKKGKLSLESQDGSKTTTDTENEMGDEVNTKRSRVSELSKVKRGRRSSLRLQRHSVESNNKSGEDIDNHDRSLKEAESTSNRISEEGSDSTKVTKGRKSSVRQSDDISKLTTDVENETVVDGAKSKTSRVSELSVKKGRRSSVRLQRPSVELFKTKSSDDIQHHNQSLKDTESTSNKLSEDSDLVTVNKGHRESEEISKFTTETENESMGEGKKVKKGRRSSLRLQRQSVESKNESSDDINKLNQSIKEAESTSNMISEGGNDTTKLKKRCKSSVRGAKQHIDADKRSSASAVTGTVTSISKDLTPKEPDAAETSSTLAVTETVPSASKDLAPKEPDQFRDITIPTVTRKRRRKLMSTQCEPSEELVIPSQSTIKKTQTNSGDDPFMFLSIEDEEDVPKRKNKVSCGRQNVMPSSIKKRKKLISSSESENEPPDGSQTSTQSSNIALIPTSRRSLEEFKDQSSTKKKTRPASQAKRRKTSALKDINSVSRRSDEDVDMSHGSVSSRKVKRQTVGKTRNGSILETSTDSDSADSTLETTKPKKRVRLGSQSVRKSKKGKPTLVMTSMHATDQELVLSIAKSLKHFKVIDTVSDSTTHIVCGDHRRTLNVLSGIARGCWLLSMQWVLNSVEVGHWLPEEPYEVHDHFPAAQISRLERVKAGESYKQDLFAPPGSIYIADNCSPPKERLLELVQLCGGQVADRLNDATLCVGNGKHKNNDIPVVAELWVLDCITQHCQLPLEPYFLTDQ